jgi:hypothetical protein
MKGLRCRQLKAIDSLNFLLKIDLKRRAKLAVVITDAAPKPEFLK